MVHISIANLGIKTLTDKPENARNVVLITIRLKFTTERRKKATILLAFFCTIFDYVSIFSGKSDDRR